MENVQPSVPSPRSALGRVSSGASTTVGNTVAEEAATALARPEPILRGE